MADEKTQTTTQNDLYARLRGAYEVANDREPFNLKPLQDALNAGDTNLVNKKIKSLLAEQNRILKKVKEGAGLRGYEFSEALGWAPEQESRAFKEDSSQRITISASAQMAESLGISITEFIFGENVLPITLPRKHILWIEAIKYLPKESKIMLADKIQNIVSEEPLTLNSVADYRTFVYRRTLEQAESLGVQFENIFLAKCPAMDRPKRKTLLASVEKEAFYGHIPTFYMISVILECAPDYFLKPDYSDYKGKFISPEGKTVKLDQGTRRVLSAMLNCDDDHKVNTFIGHICGGNTELENISF